MRQDEQDRQEKRIILSILFILSNDVEWQR
jgi:hypothetical protein